MPVLLSMDLNSGLRKDCLSGGSGSELDSCNRLRYPAKHYLVSSVYHLVSPVYHLDSLTDSLTDPVNYPFLDCTFSCIYRSSRATFNIKSFMQFHHTASLQAI